MRNKNLTTVWAWQLDFGLCQWAEPCPEALVSKPSDEAKKVKCIMMTYGEYLKLKRGK